MAVSDRLRSAILSGTSTKVRRSSVREPAMRAYRRTASLVFTGPPPKVFSNSIPKSGTHLMAHLLGQVPKLWYSGIQTSDAHYRSDLHDPGDGLGEFHLDRFTGMLRSVRNGQFVTCHFAHLPGVTAALAENGFSSMFMIRDPRDVAVSLSHYYRTLDRLPGHHRFSAMTTEQQIDATIDGLPYAEGDGRVPAMADRLRRFEAWLDDPATLVIRFEDLIGARGGGSAETQRETIRKVLAHCSRPTDDALVDKIAGKVFSENSATFRKGAIGDWRNHFTDEQAARFAELAGPLLGKYGYDA